MQTVAGVGEVAVPAQGCGAVMFGVVGTQPVQVRVDRSQTSLVWRCQQGRMTAVGRP